MVRHVWILFEIAPVRVGFGNVAAKDEMIVCFGRRTPGRCVAKGCRRSGGRDENRERVRAHERDGVGVVVHAEMFGDVHVVLFRPFGAWLLSPGFPTAYAPSEDSGQAMGCTLSPPFDSAQGRLSRLGHRCLASNLISIFLDLYLSCARGSVSLRPLPPRPTHLSLPPETSARISAASLVSHECRRVARRSGEIRRGPCPSPVLR